MFAWVMFIAGGAMLTAGAFAGVVNGASLLGALLMAVAALRILKTSN